MSQAHDPEGETETAERERPTAADEEGDDSEGDVPEIEEELVTEELRIDGICGVY